MSHSLERALSRRTLLRTAALTALAAWVRPASALALPPTASRRGPRAKNVILLWLDGGPSQLETFDPKPGCRFAGSFRSIPTTVDGVEFGEHLPRLAQRARHLAVVRSMTTPTADHVRARELGLTGHLPSETATHPLFLCSVAAELGGPDGDLPRVVTIGAPLASAGYLGDAFDPFLVSDPTRAARDLSPPPGVTPERRRDRQAFLEGLDARFAFGSVERHLQRFELQRERALRLSRSEVAVAFDLDRETPETVARYGAGPIGHGCLLARRLIDHGVRCVGIRAPGWDTHEDNFDELAKLLADFDPGLSALLDDLHASGRLDETIVLVTGEFGRTPEINLNAGRDHHWRCFTSVVAGGGVRGGQAIGASDATGHAVAARAVTVPDLLASVYFALGLDPQKTFTTPAGRPVKRLDSGEPVRELFG